MKNIKKAFSFVELIVVLSILVVVGVIGINIYNNVDENTNNSKVITGAKTLKSALSNYLQDKKILPIPDGNNNYFKIDSSYSHSGDIEAFGVYGSITENTLPKKYLNNIPLDPISHHYYSYGKTLDNKYFEVASIIRKNLTNKTKLDGTYPGENGPISLIREYNGPSFISDNSKIHFPYNPDEHILVAKLFSKGNDIKVNDITVASGSIKVLKTGDKLELGVNNFAELYFSDGSISVVGDNNSKTELFLTDMDFKDEKDNLFTKIRLFLSLGTLFTKATTLNENSDFEVYTKDTTAAVRGTIFAVKTDNDKSIVAVLEGKVEIYKTPVIERVNEDSNPIKLEKTTPIKTVISGEKIEIKNDISNSQDINIKTETGTAVLPLLQKIKEKTEKTTIPIINFATGVLNISSTTPFNNSLSTLKTEYLLNKSNNGSEEWKLYAYAGFDKDLKMKIINSKLNINFKFNSLRDCDFGEKTNIDNICILDNIKGISIDNSNNSSDYVDYLVYENLNLGKNFVIEMRVRGLNRTIGNYTLFNIGYQRLFLDAQNKTIKFGDSDPIEFKVSNATDGFDKVTFIYNNGNIKLKINDKEISPDNKNKTIIISDLDLIVGAFNTKREYEKQWNDMIDYIKIYKKEEL